MIRYKSESINNIENSKNDADRRKLLVGSLVFFQTLQNVNSRESFGTTRTSSSCENVFAGSEFKNPGVDWVILNKDKQLFYPKWFQGEWETKAKLVGVKFPMGMKYINRQTPGVTQASIAVALPDVGAGQDDVIKYTSIYSFSELEGGVVADRYNNIKYLMESFLKDKVNQVAVDYDPAKNPTRLAVRYNTKRKNRQQESFDYRKAEIFVNARKSFNCAENEFGSYELYRQVNQAKNQGYIGDYMVSNYFQMVNDNKIKVRQYVSAYLQPQDPLFFEVGDKAVVIYEYGINMERIL